MVNDHVCTLSLSLSGETANGAYPGLTVETMAKICRSAEIGEVVENRGYFPSRLMQDVISFMHVCEL